MAYMDSMGMYRRITKIYWMVGWLKRGMCHPANASGTESQEKNLMMFLAINRIYMYNDIYKYLYNVKLCAIEKKWKLLIFVRGRGSGVTEEGRPGIFNGLISLISCICHLFPEPKLKQVQLMAVPRQQSQRECSGRFLTPLGLFPQKVHVMDDLDGRYGCKPDYIIVNWIWYSISIQYTIQTTSFVFANYPQHQHSSAQFQKHTSF